MYENPAVFSSKDLSAPRRAAQFLMPRIDFSDPGSVERAERLARDFCVCGFIIFNGDVRRVRETTRRLASLSLNSRFFSAATLKEVLVSGFRERPFFLSRWPRGR